MIFKNVRITLSIWEDEEETYELCTLEQAMDRFISLYSDYLGEDVEVIIIAAM